MGEVRFVPWVIAIASSIVMTTVPKPASAACEDLIALSKITTSSVQDNAAYLAAARDYCNSVKQDKSKASSSGFELNYSGVGIGGNSASARTDSIASQTCDSSNNQSVRNDAYRNYIETIAPGAYVAYQRCKDVENNSGIQFSADPNAILEMTMTVGVVNGTNQRVSPRQNFRYSAEAGVECQWNDGGFLQRAVLQLEGNSTAFLKCKRTDSSKPTAVTVVAETVAQLPVTFPWGRYLNGEPVNALAALQQRVNAAEAVLKSIENVVVSFSANTCPDGWSEYAPAYGRFVRGIDKGSAPVDPEPKRVAGSVQASEVGPHEHVVPGTGALKRVADKRQTQYGERTSAGGGGTWITPSGEQKAIKNAGVETRPSNVALLYCVKSK